MPTLLKKNLSDVLRNLNVRKFILLVDARKLNTKLRIADSKYI